MNTIPAREIKRRGISAVDDLLERGPVHIIQYDEPRYVVLTEARYLALVEAEQDAAMARLRESVADYEAGRYTTYDSAEDLIRDLDLDEDE